MILPNKVAIVHGAGAIGGAVAREFAREGATVYITGRTESKLRALASEIEASGGRVSYNVLDALDEAAVVAHAARVIDESGRVDIMLNALGATHVQGALLTEMSLKDFESSVSFHMKTHFTTVKAVVPQMAEQGAGVILTITTPGGRLAGPGFIGNAAASGAVEAFSRALAGELGRNGVRVICLRPDAMPETLAHSYVGPMFEGIAVKHGMAAAAMLEGRAETASITGRSPRLADVAAFAAFAASDKASSMTAVIANLTRGTVVD